MKFTSLTSDDFDEYPEIILADMDSAIHRRNFVEIPKKQNISLMLDADIIAWFKKNQVKLNLKRLSMRY